MKAVRKTAPGAAGVVLQDIPEPAPGRGQIKVKVHAAGICGTDLHIMLDEYPSNYPVTLGHEYSGIVVEVGEGVTTFKPGDRVVSLTAVVTCGSCYYCRRGLLMLCDKRLSIGSGVDGAMSEYVLIPADLAFIIPSGVDMDEAALSEPLACVVRAVTETASVTAGDRVLVSGPGTIGLLALQVAMASGASVTVAGTAADQARLSLAMQLGATATVTVDRDNLREKADQLTGGLGYDVAFECAGVAASVQTCFSLLKKTGHLAQMGLFGKPVLLDLDMVLKKEITISTNFASERTSWERALRLVAERKVSLSPLISARLPLKQWAEGFDMALGKRGLGLRVLLMPNVP